MAKKYTTPGVYVEEHSILPPSIGSVETSIAIFIGYTEKAEENGNSLLQSPKQITSFPEYKNLFGNAASPTSNFCLYESLQLFFENGGGKCYIVSTGNYNNAISFDDLNNGLSNSKTIEAAILIIPDAVYLSSADFSLLQQNMLQQCGELKTRFAVLNTQLPSQTITDDILNFRNSISNKNLSWGAAYYPWLILNSGKTLPPGGAIAGVYARVDDQRGVWKAPADTPINGVTGLTNNISNNIQEKMNVDESGKSINAIRFFTGKGFIVWGARTLAGNDNEWRYVPVRRFFIMAEESITKACQQFIFEPNNNNVWVKVQGMIENFLILNWKSGALQGAKPQEAFYVAVGIGRTMTAQDVLEGNMIVEIGIAVVRPSEFIIIRILIKMQSGK